MIPVANTLHDRYPHVPSIVYLSWLILLHGASHSLMKRSRKLPCLTHTGACTAAAAAAAADIAVMYRWLVVHQNVVATVVQLTATQALVAHHHAAAVA